MNIPQQIIETDRIAKEKAAAEKASDDKEWNDAHPKHDSDIHTQAPAKPIIIPPLASEPEKKGFDVKPEVKEEAESKKAEEPKAEPEKSIIYHIIGFKKSFEDEPIFYDYMLVDEKNNLKQLSIPIDMNAKLFEPCNIEADAKTGIVTKILPLPSEKTKEEKICEYFDIMKNPPLEGIVKGINKEHGILTVSTSKGEVAVFGHELVELMGIKTGYRVKAFGDQVEKNYKLQFYANILIGKEEFKKAEKKKAEEPKAEEEKAEEEHAKDEPKIEVEAAHPYLTVAKDLQKLVPYHYGVNKIFWVWINNCWDMTDDVGMLKLLKDNLFYTEFFNGKVKSGIMDALKISGRSREIKEVPKKWVYTLNGVYDIETKAINPATPEHFFTNPIPHKIGESESTPTIEKLFKEWGGDDYVSLYEWIAYLLYNGYPIHRIFTIFGPGGNGKGQYAELCKNTVGDKNTCTASLSKLLTSRFEAAKLYRKLLCIIDETPDEIASTNELKGLSGEGNISVEFKGGTPFDMQNKAKLTMLTNNVPQTKDKTDAWYRRSKLIAFPKVYDEGKRIIDIIPEEEYENLIFKSLNSLGKIIESGKFSNDLNIEERKIAYERASNLVKHFIDEFCDMIVGIETPSWQLMEVFNNKYVTKYPGTRPHTKSSFNKALDSEGLDTYMKNYEWEGHRHNNLMVLGIALKAEYKKKEQCGSVPFHKPINIFI